MMLSMQAIQAILDVNNEDTIDASVARLLGIDSHIVSNLRRVGHNKQALQNLKKAQLAECDAVLNKGVQALDAMFQDVTQHALKYLLTAVSLDNQQAKASGYTTVAKLAQVYQGILQVLQGLRELGQAKLRSWSSLFNRSNNEFYQAIVKKIDDEWSKKISQQEPVAKLFKNRQNDAEPKSLHEFNNLLDQSSNYNAFIEEDLSSECTLLELRAFYTDRNESKHFVKFCLQELNLVDDSNVFAHIRQAFESVSNLNAQDIADFSVILDNKLNQIQDDNQKNQFGTCIITPLVNQLASKKISIRSGECPQNEHIVHALRLFDLEQSGYAIYSNIMHEKSKSALHNSSMLIDAIQSAKFDGRHIKRLTEFTFEDCIKTCLTGEQIRQQAVNLTHVKADITNKQPLSEDFCELFMNLACHGFPKNSIKEIDTGFSEVAKLWYKLCDSYKPKIDDFLEHRVNWFFMDESNKLKLVMLALECQQSDLSAQYLNNLVGEHEQSQTKMPWNGPFLKLALRYEQFELAQKALSKMDFKTIESSDKDDVFP